MKNFTKYLPNFIKGIHYKWKKFIHWCFASWWNSNRS